MKKIETIILALIGVLSLTSCTGGYSECEIPITIPEESTGKEYVYSDKLFTPTDSEISISMSRNSSEATLRLKRVDADGNEDYDPIPLETGISFSIPLEAGGWYQLGAYVPSSDDDVFVNIYIENVEFEEQD